MDSCANDLVRLFPDYADTVIWFPFPVDYADTGLDDDLLGRRLSLALGPEFVVAVGGRHFKCRRPARSTKAADAFRLIAAAEREERERSARVRRRRRAEVES